MPLSVALLRGRPLQRQQNDGLDSAETFSATSAHRDGYCQPIISDVG